MFWLYNFLFLLLSPIWIPLLWWKNRSRPDKVDWRQRQGAFPIEPRPDRKRIWVHAVSVGEVIAAKPILERVRKLIPDHEIILTCTTGTGHKTATEQLAGIVDHVFFFPIDIARFMFSAMVRVQPSVVAVMETELWMNFLAMAKQFGATTMLINGRISDRSFERSKIVRPLMRAIVRNLDLALMQTQVDADRIGAYGGKSIEVLGNSKYDEAMESGGKSGDEWREELMARQEDFVVVVGSTRGPEEEAFVFDALERLNKDGLKIVYAPRHMDRVEAIEERANKSFQTARRSKGEMAPFLILDTYGELASVYGAANVAVIGGGFTDHGGQNLIQALAHGTPVIHGVHMQNFAEATAAALKEGASIEVRSSSELVASLNAIRNEGKWTEMMWAAKQMMGRNLGASDRYAQAIADAANTFQADHAEWLEKRKSVHSKP